MIGWENSIDMRVRNKNEEPFVLGFHQLHLGHIQNQYQYQIKVCLKK